VNLSSSSKISSNISSNSCCCGGGSRSGGGGGDGVSNSLVIVWLPLRGLVMRRKRLLMKIT